MEQNLINYLSNIDDSYKIGNLQLDERVLLVKCLKQPENAIRTSGLYMPAHNTLKTVNRTESEYIEIKNPYKFYNLGVIINASVPGIVQNSKALGISLGKEYTADELLSIFQKTYLIFNRSIIKPILENSEVISYSNAFHLGTGFPPVNEKDPHFGLAVMSWHDVIGFIKSEKIDLNRYV